MYQKLSSNLSFGPYHYITLMYTLVYMKLKSKFFNNFHRTAHYAQYW